MPNEIEDGASMKSSLAMSGLGSTSNAIGLHLYPLLGGAASLDQWINPPEDVSRLSGIWTSRKYPSVSKRVQID